MRLSAVHSTSVARTVSLDIKEHSGRSAMGVTSADRRKNGAADIFLEIITQPFPGFDGIVPDSSNQATV